MEARILIVEDNPDLLAILHELLSQDYKVETARRGEDAITLARTFRPNVILLDLQLPGIDGIETGKWIKRDMAPESVAILALTALAGAGEAEAILACGCCDAYMAKPASLPEIRAKVEELLHFTRRAA
ncbi:MAG: response regulator transcription factor [Gemmatimonadota bacterium]